MTERLSCPSCEAVRDVETVERKEKVTIKGREIAFVAQFSRCATCGDEFEAPGQLDRNLATAREAYSRLYEAPTVEAMIALRSAYGASQKAFGLILGFGELTMNSYEQGAAPDSTNRMLLKLAETPIFFKAMYDLNSARIGAIQRRRIEASKAFMSTNSWMGLEALAATLTSVQRGKVEACADSLDQSVLKLVVSYVNAASFQDYSQLLLGAQWRGGEANPVTTETINRPVDLSQAAS